jgi:hypothetical protein
MTLAENTAQSTINESADFWRYDIGVNVIPADTKNKTTNIKWSEYQDTPISEELHNRWKSEGTFSKGIAIILGKAWHREDRKDLYFTFIDTDKQEAIEELCTKNEKRITLQEMAQKFLVEQHKDSLLEKAHIYMYSPIPFPQKTADSALGLEVKGTAEHGIAFCFPSIHKDGLPYEIIGTNQPVTLSIEQAKEMIQHIDNICKKHGLEYLDKHYRNLLDSDCKIYQGSRHDWLLRLANSLLFRYLGKGGKSEEEIKAMLMEINNTKCVPSPLPDAEINEIWKDAADYVKQRKQKEAEDSGSDSYSAAEEALELAEKKCSDLFVDQYSAPYAAVRIDKHLETLPLNSTRFRNWLCKEFYEKENAILNSESINSVLNILKAKAEFGVNRKTLHLRIGDIAEDPYTIYYDLTNKDWQAVKITATESNCNERTWTIGYSPVIFRRYSNQQPQVYPCREYSSDIFDRFMELINIKDEDNKLLLKCYIIALFIPGVPKPVLMLHGEQGSAKSTLQELIKMLVDPSSILTLSFPRDINELIQKLSHNYVAYFDNISSIKEWISDELCRAVTGSGFSKRQLYTDDDDVIYNFKRCIGFNGINLGATKADLLDRGLIIQLERISKEKRRKLSDIWNDFEKIKPQLLGYIFDILVDVVQVKKNGGIKLNSQPRMADFAEIAEIISRSMRNRNNKFLETYHKNIGLQTEQALEASPVASCIIKFMDSRIEWKGTATELLNELEEVAEALKISTNNNRLWASAPNSLSRRLNEVKTNLREIGIIIERPVDTATNTRLIEIRKISPESPESSAAENQAQNKPKSGGDITGYIHSISPEVYPENTNQDRAQNHQSGDSGYTGDYLHMSTSATAVTNPYPNVGESYGCYYCNRFSVTYDRSEYERHVIVKHPGKLCYPTKAELDRLGIADKGKSWEI